MKFVQGKLSDAEVAKNVTGAWNACQRSAKQALQQAGSEGILAGSIRTAYNKYCAFKKQNKQAVDSMERRKVDLVEPVMRQQDLHAYWDKGELIDSTDVLEISAQEDENEVEEGVGFRAVKESAGLGQNLLHLSKLSRSWKKARLRCVLPM